MLLLMLLAVCFSRFKQFMTIRNLTSLFKPQSVAVIGASNHSRKVGLNASFAHTEALAGKVAFVSQSGALCTAVLDWAKPRKIGFSHFISLGDSADVNFADVLDYLASDRDT